MHPALLEVVPCANRLGEQYLELRRYRVPLADDILCCCDSDLPYRGLDDLWFMHSTWPSTAEPEHVTSHQADHLFVVLVELIIQVVSEI